MKILEWNCTKKGNHPVLKYECKRVPSVSEDKQRGKSDGGRVYAGHSSKCELKEIEVLFAQVSMCYYMDFGFYLEWDAEQVVLKARKIKSIIC